MVEYTKGKRVVRKDWRVGEVYFTRSGTMPFNLQSKDSWAYTAKYIDSGKVFPGTSEYLIEAIEVKEKEETMATKKLYQIIGEDVFGEHIATNSLGHYVLEIKGTSEVRVLPKESVEEVFPYTVEVNINGNKYSFLADKGSVEVGDIVIQSDEPYAGTLMVVTALGTKSSKATKRLTGTVVKGVKVS